jgi:hypothetical protein
MKPLYWLSISLVALALAAGVFVAFQYQQTEHTISEFQERVAQLGANSPAPTIDMRRLNQLPAPVQRYFAYVFPGEIPRYAAVRLTAEGEFRRPQTDAFNLTTAEQVIAIGTPALMFSATTPILPMVWARAYDFFANGQMEMKAKILSTVTVVDETETPELNQISLRRWLLESALYPAALLPGGPVTWEPVDDQTARAVIKSGGLQARMLAHFDATGQMTYMSAEADGDLNSPYHGSGEHVTRSDYQRVGSQIIPMQFTISRASGGKIYPFWKGRVTSIAFE